MSESSFKEQFIFLFKERLPDRQFFFISPAYGRSIPDLVILGPGVWAALEFKVSKNAHRQPNQEWYIESMKEMGYASFVYPENAEEVLDDLERLFAA